MTVSDSPEFNLLEQQEHAIGRGLTFWDVEISPEAPREIQRQQLLLKGLVSCSNMIKMVGVNLQREPITPEGLKRDIQTGSGISLEVSRLSSLLQTMGVLVLDTNINHFLDIPDRRVIPEFQKLGSTLSRIERLEFEEFLKASRDRFGEIGEVTTEDGQIRSVRSYTDDARTTIFDEALLRIIGEVSAEEWVYLGPKIEKDNMIMPSQLPLGSKFESIVKSDPRELANLIKAFRMVIHDVGNPIAALKANYQLLRRNPEREGAAETTAGRLEAIFKNLIGITDKKVIEIFISPEKGKNQMPQEQLDDIALAKRAEISPLQIRYQLILGIEALLKVNGVRFEGLKLTDLKNGIFTLSPIDFAELIGNLAQNCIRQKAKNVWARLEYAEDMTFVDFVFEDDGGGFKPEHLAMPPFSWGSTHGGKGIGMEKYIEQFDKDYGIKFKLGNRPEGGASIRLRIPAKSSS